MGGSLNQLSNVISVSSENSRQFVVNNEWSFIMPAGFSYKVDAEFDGGIAGGIDLSGSKKPLVIKGLKSGSKYLFNFALKEHYDAFGNYYSIVDCKYDNRMADADSGASQKIITDEDTLYVDIITVSMWPFGTDVSIRVRGDSIIPFNFTAVISGMDENDFAKVVTALKEIAGSIKLVNQTKTSKNKTTTKKTEKPKPEDPNCVIEGTVLVKYIGSSLNIVLPEGLTEIADNTFSGRKIKSIVIPEGVKTIGRRVFENCFELEEVILPSTLKELGEYSFVDCHKLKSVNLGKKLTAISNSLFSECYELEDVVIPPKTKYIDAFAFKNCRKFKSIVIPNGVESIGFTAFTNCKNLSYLYIPASVMRICDNFMDDTPFGGCDILTIHCSAGSVAEDYCKSHGINYVIDDTPKKVTAKKTPRSGIKQKNTSDGDISAIRDSINAISDQTDAIQAQNLSAEDSEALNEAMGQISGLLNDLSASRETMNKYNAYLEQKEAREKAEKEEKEKKKAAAMAGGKSEEDIVNMYIILTNEKKLGKLRRSQKEFSEIYEEDFPAFSKTELINTRKEVLKEMKDASRCEYYTSCFMKRSVEDRFIVSTRNLNNVSEKPEIGDKADWAIENTKEWYSPDEYDEVRRLMDADLVDLRQQLDDQFISVDKAWTNYTEGKDFLQICISEKKQDGSDLQSNQSNFQVVINDQLVEVKIATKGLLAMSTTVLNFFPWYWGVTVRDIWETALKNDLWDKREETYNGSQLANQAVERIRIEHPETKVTSKANPPFNTVLTNSKSVNLTSEQTKRQETSITSTQQTPLPKKEGCYIATAVYGSYNAPQVLTLRRFRDEKLKNTVLGRWFIKTYYRLSPPIAEKLKDAKRINSFVRVLLDKWVELLNSKS